MVNKKQHASEEPEVVIETAIGKTEEFIHRNGKTLLTILAVAVVLVGGYFGYQYLYQAPRQEKAATAMFNAQHAFAADSFALALNGDGNTQGFLQIIEKYGSTPSGNLAKHYAGQCYLRQGQYQEAIGCFEDYKNVKGIPAQLINSLNAGFMGDAYVQLGNLEKGASLYEEAVSTGEDQLTTPYYSQKAGAIYEMLGNNKKALEMYNIVKLRFPNSMEARDIDKYIAQVEQKL